jgi:hypothetical protein
VQGVMKNCGYLQGLGSEIEAHLLCRNGLVQFLDENYVFYCCVVQELIAG